VRHPLHLLKITLRGALLLFSPDAEAGLSRFVVARILAMLLFHLPLAAGLFVGTVRAFYERNAALMVLSLFTACYLLAHAPGAVAGGRYSVPMLPILIVVGSYGLWGDPSAPDSFLSTNQRVANGSGQRSYPG